MSGERTYRPADLAESRRRWAEGEFGVEWQPYRRLAAERGFIFPPEGSRWDSWEDDEPSQRAIVYRAIEDMPRLLSEAIRTSRGWGQVVARLMRDLARIREDAGLAERDAEWARAGQPTRREALESYAEITRRMVRPQADPEPAEPSSPPVAEEALPWDR